ncbi:hypothetical protein COCCU_08250 [Corynebacterium occultum]|uniref:DUF3710 domain-containing protein n=1 Tax=Corynebacterium occultum TaxID=2675219 RepID=A0A6B8W233_9CORY|nr:DUF3710 domain-containing protein [Corynebacterium occultum]QGU07574.1 hypothetical protein COCCU_08250 [Corynebacterium occultum]
MALWPFGKKKQDNQVTAKEEVSQPVAAEAEHRAAETAAVTTPAAESLVAASPEPAPMTAAEQPDPVHDATGGGTGPFDGDTVNIEEFDFQDFSTATLNLGSMNIPLPTGSQVQVEMAEQGPKMLHIVTTAGRITPVAFAAPRKPGQWAQAATDIAEGMRKEGLEVLVEQGPWGREVVGSSANGIIRIIGVDGPRWMLRMTLAAPAEKAEELANLGREVTARTFVYRGEDPILAGSALPVALPAQLAQQVQQAMQQRTQQAQGGQQVRPAGQPPAVGQPGGSGPAALSPEQEQALREAQDALRSQGNSETKRPENP